MGHGYKHWHTYYILLYHVSYILYHTSYIMWPYESYVICHMLSCSVSWAFPTHVAPRIAHHIFRYKKINQICSQDHFLQDYLPDIFPTKLFYRIIYQICSQQNFFTGLFTRFVPNKTFLQGLQPHFNIVRKPLFWAKQNMAFIEASGWYNAWNQNYLKFMSHWFMTHIWLKWLQENLISIFQTIRKSSFWASVGKPLRGEFTHHGAASGGHLHGLHVKLWTTKVYQKNRHIKAKDGQSI